jgi:uncharacterized membrane protein
MSSIDYGLGIESSPGEQILVQARNQDQCRQVNVGPAERAISGIVGGGLIAAGLTRRSGLGAGLAVLGAGLVQRAVTGRCYLYQSLGINTAVAPATGHHNRAVGVRARHGRKHEATIVISRRAAELYDYWRQLHRLPKLFEHLISVVESDGGRSHWVARGPLAKRVEWEAEIYNERPGEMIAWRSIPGSDLDTAGSIHFKSLPSDESRSSVTLSMKYDPPAGEAGSAIADWLGESMDDELDEGLRRFKQLTETGEVPSVVGQPPGSCRST